MGCDNRFPPTPENILDGVVMSKTSGLKSAKSQDRKLALKAMCEYVNEFIRWQKTVNCDFLNSFDFDTLVDEIKKRYEEDKDVY